MCLRGCENGDYLRKEARFPSPSGVLGRIRTCDRLSTVAVRAVLILKASVLVLQYCRISPAKQRKSGEGGIRTHEAVLHRLRDFQSRSFGQLGHLSVRTMSLPDEDESKDQETLRPVCKEASA